MTASTCGTCEHYRQGSERGHLGECARWQRGYAWESAEIPVNEVVVEDDEGWGALMGPDFGCVLWETKKPQLSPGPS